MTQTPSKTHLRLHDARSELTDNGVLDAVDAVLAELLPREVAPPYPDKIIKDLVWGVITIPGFLLPLVDSRLFQRQRRIRQLGVSYLVYPGSGYGRFEHGLGCCHVMAMILRAVGDRGGAVTDRVRTQLLTGALLHDIGHLPFSHASERGLEQWLDRLLIGTVSARQVIKTLNKAVSLPLKPAEAISVLVVLSETFRSTIGRLTQSKHSDDDFCIELAAFLSGARLRNDQVAFSQVLSGAVDCDRLDYVARDSKVCGIPVSVDVGRLLHRCEFVSVEVNRLPESMRGMLTETSPARVFVTDLSGANALEEMAMSRFVLYDRVYNHQKTQAAEGILRELLDISVEEGVISSQLLSFWKQNDEEFLYRALDHAKTRSLAERLLYRDLPRRAVVYGFSLMERNIVPFDAVTTDEPTDSVEHGAEKNISRGIDDVLLTLDETVRVAEQRRVLVAKIIERAKVLARLVPVNHRPHTELKSLFLAHRPDSPLQTLNSAYVMDPDGSIRLLQEHMPLQEWSNAFNVNKAFGYIFCDDGWQNVVHIAAEMVLWEDYSSEIGPFRLLSASRRSLAPAQNSVPRSWNI